MPEQRVPKAAEEAAIDARLKRDERSVELRSPIESLREDLQAAAPHIRQQERQRIREALIGEDARLAWGGRNLLVSRETLARIFDALDTLEDGQ